LYATAVPVIAPFSTVCTSGGIIRQMEANEQKIELSTTLKWILWDKPKKRS